MINGLYNSASGMDADMVKMDVVTNNLANVSTKGFKKDEAVFTAFPTAMLSRINDRFDTLRSLNAGSLAPNAPFAGAATQPVGVVGRGIQIDGVETNFSDGSVVDTGNSLDLALSGKSLFTLERPDGSTAYTRSGNFSMDSNGHLSTIDGDLVMGRNGQPISVDGKQVTIDSTGRVLVDSQETGRLQFADWDPKDFTKQGEGLYVRNEADIEVSTDAAPVEAKVTQGFLEQANVKVVKEMVDLITVTRSYEANQKAVQIQDETLDKAVNDVGKTS